MYTKQDAGLDLEVSTTNRNNFTSYTLHLTMLRNVLIIS